MEAQTEQNNTNASNIKQKFNRANISPELYGMYATVKHMLSKREVEISFVDFSTALGKYLPDDVISRLIEDLTPIEWHLKEMMAKPEYKQEFMKLADKLRKR
jgi:hypothetical protein